MNDIVNRNSYLPDNFAEMVEKGIEDTRATLTVGDGGVPLFRLIEGTYVFGVGDDEVQEGSHWAVLLPSMQRGWCCWKDGKLLGQTMSWIFRGDPMPPCPAPQQGVPFTEQYAFEMTCIDGEDKDTAVLYKNNSMGFKRMFDTLISEVRQRIRATKGTPEAAFFWPLVTWKWTSYEHKTYHRTIYNPIAVITDWTDQDGNIAGQTPKVSPPKAEAAAPPPAAEPAKPARKRKAPLTVVQADPPKAETPAPEAPVSTQQAHVGQRRRPVR